MLSDQRWEIEMEIVRTNFPWFKPFMTGREGVGFLGNLRGPRSKRLFQVVIKIPARLYPDAEPPVYIDPKLTMLWWRADDVNGRAEGRLCYHRREGGSWHDTPWQPAKHTFCNCIGFAVQYIQEFDR